MWVVHTSRQWFGMFEPSAFGIAELDCVVFLLFLSRTQVTVLTLGDTILMSLYIHRLELPRRWLAHGETF